MQTKIAQLLQSLTQGVYIVGVGQGAAAHAFTAAWVMQVSFQPTLVAVSVNPHNRSYALLKQGGAYSINVLSAEQLHLARHFGQPGRVDKMNDVAWRTGRLGVPVLDAVPAWIECQVMQEQAAGDHMLVVGRVLNGEVRAPDTKLLTYADTGSLDDSVKLFPNEL